MAETKRALASLSETHRPRLLALVWVQGESDASAWYVDTGAQLPMTGELKVPDILVKKATPVFGTVVDQSGTPLTRVRVNASWVQRHDVESHFTLKSDAAQTDSQGRFRLEHVLPDADVRLTAQTTDAATNTATTIHTSEPREVKLQISPEGMLKLSGKVRGSDGAVISSATIKISRAMVAPDGSEYGFRVVEWSGEKSFHGDQRGQFESPGTIPRFGKYSITISAPGYLGVETAFLTPPQSGSTFELPETILTKARTAIGTVRDSSGNSVAGASVSAYAVSQDGGRNQTQRTQNVF